MKQYHIALDTSDAGKYCILPGDPARCEKIAKYLDSPKFIVSNREFTTWSGLLNGERVLVTSTGIGGPSAAIAMEELAAIGVKTFIRVGTCGGINM
ncbi:MAG: uridine phosphorylase, partial [Synergistaceae bacterium]|nr:uridine phosphorylase [Synergistaceae bacterium]